MRRSSSPCNRRRARAQASARVATLVLVCFFAGIAVTAFWYHRGPGPSPTATEPQASPSETAALSEGTTAVLKRLDSPVEIRFYNVLDAAATPESLRAFSARVNQLVTEYARASHGKVTVKRYESLSSATARAAAADGLQPFNLDKSDGCYLGLVIARNNSTESLTRLAPEWEPALEADLTRALERVLNSTRPPATTPPVRATVPPDTTAIEEVKRALPNVASVSVAEGTRLLREAALAEYTSAAKEMDAQVKEAQQRLVLAQGNNSGAEQQAALQHLQEVQTEQREKLIELAAQLQARITALEQIKKQ